MLEPKFVYIERRGCYCEPDCPFIDDRSEYEQCRSLKARCTLLDVDLYFYDWWIASCCD